jgi:acyl carrier protein
MDKSPDQIIRQLMSDVLELPLESITDATTMQTTDTWDSLRHMELVVAIEGELGIEFEALELMELVSLPEIKRVLATKGVQA